MKEFVLFVIRHLVNDPAAVEVKETRGDTASVIELNVAKEDLGRVIGKASHTVAALRTIMTAFTAYSADMNRAPAPVTSIRRCR